MADGGPLTYEDFWDFKIVSDVRLSPDGKRAAYVVSTLDRGTDEERSAIWTVDLRSGETRKFTAGSKRDSQPRWSPDGEWLAFASTREGDTAQIYVMSTLGGEARRVTDGDDPAGSPAWSPDSKRIACTVMMQSDRQKLPSEVAWVEEKKDERKDKPQIRLLTEPKYRFDGRGYIDRRSHIFVVDREGGEPTRLTEGDFDNLEPAWSPDGSAIAFVSNRTPDRDYNFASDIWLLEVESGEQRRLNQENLTASSPAWSPDGRTVAFYAEPEWARNGTQNTNLWTVSREGGDARPLTADFDRTHGALLGDYSPIVPLAPAWAPDGQSIYFSMSDRGREALCRVPAGGGGVDIISEGGVHVGTIQPAPDCSAVICCASTPTRPFDVFRIPSSGGPPEQVTNANRDLLDRVQITAPQHITYSSVDGWEMEGWLLRPQRTDGPCPLVLFVHGGPHGMYGTTFYYNMQVLAGHGIACLYINPRGSGGYGLEFMRAVCAEWGGKDFQDLMNGIDHVLESGDIDPDRLAITGGSYGGFMTNWAIGHTDRFACAVGINGLSNLVSFWGTSDIGALWFDQQMGGPYWERPELYRDLSPLTYVTNMSTPLLLIHAERDYRVPIEQSEQLFVALKIRRCEVELARIPDASHGLAMAPGVRHRVERWQLAKDWFDRYLSKGRAMPA